MILSANSNQEIADSLELLQSYQKSLLNVPMRQFWMDDAQLNAYLDYGNSYNLFYFAGFSGHQQLFEYLYETVISVPFDESTNAPNRGRPLSQHDTYRLQNFLLIFATARGYVTVVKILLRSQPNDPQDPMRQTILHESFTIACRQGHLDIVNMLLNEIDGLDPTVNNNEAIQGASSNGEVEIVNLLLGLDGVDTTANENEAIKSASANGYLDVVELLLQVPRVKTSPSINESIHRASARGHLQVVKFLIELELDKINIDGLSRNAVPDASKVRELRQQLAKTSRFEMRVNVTASTRQQKITFAFGKRHNMGLLKLYGYCCWYLKLIQRLVIIFAITEAAAGGHLAVVQLLQRVHGIDASAYDNEAIRWACSYGLSGDCQDINVDASSKNNQAIRYAARNGYVDIVKLLLDVPGVDPTDKDNEALRMAASQGHYEIVKLLLQLPGVDATVCDTEAIRLAAAGGYLDIVKLLAGIPGVDHMANGGEAINGAATNDHIHLNKAFQDSCCNGDIGQVRLLLVVDGIDASALDSQAIISASTNGHVEIVKLLLEVEGVDSTAQNNVAFRHAAANGVDVTADDCLLICMARENGYFALAGYFASADGLDDIIKCRESFRNACVAGYGDLIQSWLSFPGDQEAKMKMLDPAGGDNYAIRWASRNGHFDNFCWRWRGHSKVVELLLTVPGVHLESSKELVVSGNTHFTQIVVLLSVIVVSLVGIARNIKR
ncbi:hypothetical protein HDU76_000307 [Blyttiomyces sp. JEL0837]|nr:hypothetical protein HDU76_000307 [Blyttiomyces sp. JEL0837]